jgi:hypothetical protein
MIVKSVAVAPTHEGRRDKGEKVQSRVIKDQRPGLAVERFFTANLRPGQDPFETVEWERRDAVISGADGKVFFEQRGVEFPKTWSQTATNVVVQKYFRGTLGTPSREDSVRTMIARVADTIYSWGKTDGYFKSEQDAWAFRDELVHLLLHQKMAFNSPVWFNVGVEDYPQCSACFINSVDDSMGSILGLAKTEGMLFKYGSGTGSNLSTLRSSREHLNGGGTASGPVSFMRGFDAFAGAIKSGGKTRRAAKMVILNVDHPDIVDFIDCKADRGAEGVGADRCRLRRRLQRRRRRVRLGQLPEREPLGPRHRRLHALRHPKTASGRPARSPTAARSRRSRRATSCARWPTPRGSAVTPASSTTPRSTTGTPASTRRASTRRTRARSTCSSTTRRATWRR